MERERDESKEQMGFPSAIMWLFITTRLQYILLFLKKSEGYYL
jgi:hypothetical protein